MLGKLALRNAKRSIKDYSIYILSITIIISLLYAFNLIINSKDILKLCNAMRNMPYIVTTASILIVFVSTWLVHYMNNFMLQRRSKEFGIYMSLGISNKAIARLFLCENILTGSVSFLISLAAGTFLYQILTMIIMKVFEAPYEIKIAFSLKALLLTFLYVILIYTFSLIRSKRRLRKMTIYNLLYAEKRNETQRFHNLKWSWLIFTFSLIAGVIGGIVLWNDFNDGDNDLSLRLLGISFLCGIIFIYGFYLSVPSMLIRLLVDNKRIKYKNGLYLLVRSLSAKANTMRITLGTLGMLLTFTLASFSVGIMFKEYFDSQVSSISPFEIAISSKPSEKSLEEYKNYIHENLHVEGEVSYYIYKSGITTIYDMISDTPVGGSSLKDDTVMKYSDYQKLRKLLGYPEVELKEGCFLIQCVLGVKNEVEKETNIVLKFKNRTLKYQSSFLEDFALQGINGEGYVIIVPDEYTKTLEARQIIYAANTKEKTIVEDYINLNAYNPMKLVTYPDGTFEEPQDEVRVKGQLIAESRTVFTIFSFSLFYMGLVFICIAATILAVHHLSDSIQYKFRYRILRNLGMEDSKVDHYILKQCLFYFGFPIILPIPISIFITNCFDSLFKTFISMSFMFTAILSSIGLFLAIYILYFIATFLNYRKNVSE